MKKSLIWTAVGAVVIGFGVPAYAAVQTSKPQPSISVVTPARQVSNASLSQRSVTVDDSTRNSIDDNGVDATVTSIDDNGVDATDANDANDDNGVDANDAADDNGVDATVTSIDDNGVDATPGTVADDSGHHNGGDNSGHGGSDG